MTVGAPIGVAIGRPIGRLIGAGADGSWSANFLAGEFPSNITYSRASSAQDFNDPALTYGTNVPVLTPSGWLLQGARTNLVLRSQELGTGAVWVPTSVGAAVPTVTATNILAPDGTNTAVRVSFPVCTAGQSSFLRQVITGLTNPTTLAPSIYIKAADSSTQAVIRQGNGAAGYQTMTISSTWSRLQPNSGSNALTFFNFDIGRDNTTNGGAVASIDLWGAQLEAGALASSYIPTTGTTATRAADVATISNLASIGFSATEGTFLAEFSLIGLDAATALRVLRVDDGTGNNFIGLSKGGGSTNLIGSLVVSGVATNTAALVALSANTTFRAAEAYNSSGVAGVANGGTVQTAGTSSPSGLTTLRLGSGVSGENLFGYLRRLVYYPTRLPDATLQALTA